MCTKFVQINVRCMSYVYSCVHIFAFIILLFAVQCCFIVLSISLLLFINASIVQGSVIGPFTFVIIASDLRALYALNKLYYYADDSYLIVPCIYSQLVREELNRISTWASNNNLMLNVNKSKEMVIKRPRTRTAAPPSPPWDRVCEKYEYSGGHFPI